MTTRVIQVQFPETTHKRYSYFTDDDDIQEGDFVIVQVCKEFKVVQVAQTRGLSQSALTKASRWIVQRDALVRAREMKAKVVQEIKNRLAQRRNEINEILIYQQLAGSDPTIQELLGELKNLAPELVPTLPQQSVKGSINE